MRFTNNPYEGFMKEKSYFKGAPPNLPPVREKSPAAHRARPGFRDALHGQRPFQHGIKG